MLGQQAPDAVVGGEHAAQRGDVADAGDHLRDAGRDDLARQRRVGLGAVEADEAEHVVGVELGPELRRLLEHRDARAQPVELDVDRLLARLRPLDVGARCVSPRARATATAVPSDGCPANGISPPIVKIRWR